MKRILKYLSMKRQEHLEARIDAFYNQAHDQAINSNMRRASQIRYNELHGVYIRRYGFPYIPLAKQEEIRRAANNGRFERPRWMARGW